MIACRLKVFIVCIVSTVAIQNVSCETFSWKFFSNDVRISAIGEEFSTEFLAIAPLSKCSVKIPRSDSNLQVSNTSLSFQVNSIRLYYDLDNSTCKLTIESLEDIHSGIYKFSVVTTDNQQFNGQFKLLAVKKSSPVKMYVRDSDRETFEAGEYLQARCVVEDGRLLSTIEWFMGSDKLINHNNHTTIIDSSRRTGLTSQNITIKLQSTFNNKELKCVVDHLTSDHENKATYKIHLSPRVENKKKYIVSEDDRGTCNMTILVKSEKDSLIDSVTEALAKDGMNDFCFSIHKSESKKYSTCDSMTLGIVIVILFMVVLILVGIYVMIFRTREKITTAVPLEDIGQQRFVVTPNKYSVMDVKNDTHTINKQSYENNIAPCLSNTNEVPEDNNKLKTPASADNQTSSGSNSKMKKSEIKDEYKCDVSLKTTEVPEVVQSGPGDEYMVMVRGNND